MIAVPRLIEFLNRAANELDARRHPAQGRDTLAIEARQLMDELGYLAAPPHEDFDKQQQAVVEAIHEWNARKDAAEPEVRVMAALAESCRLVRQYPLATAYLLAIWYERDTPEEDHAGG